MAEAWLGLAGAWLGRTGHGRGRARLGRTGPGGAGLGMAWFVFFR